MSKKMSVVVPCYNEEKNIPLILEKFKAAISDESIEVILVNNGSTDNSAFVINSLIEKYPFARTVYVEKNQGYGYGILQGLKVCTGDFLGWTHADLQTDPADLIKVYYILLKNNWNENVFVKGRRKGRSFTDVFFTFGMSMFETIYLKKKLYDINAQPNIFSKEFFNTWENPPYDFSLDLYALYKAKGKKMKIERFEVVFPPRIHGTSHWNTGILAKWKFIKRTIQFSIKLKKGGIR